MKALYKKIQLMNGHKVFRARDDADDDDDSLFCVSMLLQAVEVIMRLSGLFRSLTCRALE